MPSLQSVPLIQVFDYLNLPGSSTQTTGPAAPTINVRATLQFNQATFSNPVVGLLAKTIATTVNSQTGYWTLYLAANTGTTHISPSGTTWLIQIDGYAPYEIQVTDVAVPAGGWQSSGLVVNSPSGLGPFAPTLPSITVNGNAIFHGPDPWFDVTHPLFAGGAVGDGVTDDSAAINAAIAAASAAGGGTVYFPLAVYYIASTIHLAQYVNLLGTWNIGGSSTHGSAIKATTAINLLTMPNTNSSTEIYGGRIENLHFIGGTNQLYSPNGAVWVLLRNLTFDSPTVACIQTAGFVQEWFLRDIVFNAGQYGFYLAAAGTASAMLYDKCNWYSVYCNGQTINGIYIVMNSGTGNTNSFEDLRIVTVQQDGAVFGGALAELLFTNVNTESNGYLGSAPLATTTATTVATSPTVTVASGTGINNGAVVTIAGAGTNGVDWYPTVSSGGGTTTLTMTTNAPTSVTSAELTIYTYSDFKFIVAGAAAPSGVTFVGAKVGITSSLAGLRYAIDLTNGSAVVLISCINNRPIYDPASNVVLITPTNATTIRRPSGVTTADWRTSSFGGVGAPRTIIGSPPGKDIVLALADSTANNAGTMGVIEGRRADSNRTRFLFADSWGRFYKSMASTPTTGTLNAHITSATLTGKDQSGSIVFVVDGTGVAAGQVLCRVTFGQNLLIAPNGIGFVVADVTSDTTLAPVRFSTVYTNPSSFTITCEAALTAGKTYTAAYQMLS